VTENGLRPPEPATAAEYECNHCQRGRCSRCTNETCTCCSGVLFGDQDPPGGCERADPPSPAPPPRPGYALPSLICNVLGAVH